MKKFCRDLFAYLLIVALSYSTTPLSPLAWAEEPYRGPVTTHSPSNYPQQSPVYHQRHRPPAELMIFDGLVVRPLMLGVTVVGAGLFIVTLPFSLLGSNVDQAADRLVAEPARWVFINCLGCLPPDDYYQGHPYPVPPTSTVQPAPQP